MKLARTVASAALAAAAAGEALVGVGRLGTAGATTGRRAPVATRRASPPSGPLTIAAGAATGGTGGPPPSRWRRSPATGEAGIGW